MSLAVHSSSVTPSHTRIPPRRVLYEHQIGDSSTEDDITQANVTKIDPPSALGIAIALSPLTQSINVIVVFLQIFQRLEEGGLQPAALVLACLASLLAAKLAWTLLLHRWVDESGDAALGKRPTSSPSMVVSFAILLLLLYALSPVLKTLTEATANDTIYPLSFMLFGLHICLGNNTMARTVTRQKERAGRRQEPTGQIASLPASEQPPQLFSALSLNAATSASLVLASRLPSNVHVFALLFASVLCFALFPIYVRRLRSVKLRLAICALLIPMAIGLAWPVSRSMCVVDVGLNVFILGVVPFWMRAASKGKVKYDGPWRVAKPQLRRRRYSAL
ncbi:GPI2-domain-containing protein [Microstroma glucosiphilum]|uniref:GPI2-domain-containing protein n=1 Tax=Pseudomicrostroma glucosiphilum TaxID=1684307 RepID=A0A316U859_9BASI|nr:GPI2-domain-containing protein [Pseudomicrostroma glucosiphilum]PWN20651.1 GPI2-domain-containing protein [Pseudomicrostroma glucosiphilum]